MQPTYSRVNLWLTSVPFHYIRNLLSRSIECVHVSRLTDILLFVSEVTREVARVQASGKPLPKESKYVDIYREKPIRVAVKVLVPIKEHPKV